MEFYQKMNKKNLFFLLIYLSSLGVFSDVQNEAKDKIILIEEVDCKQEIILDDDKTNLKNDKDFSVKLLDKENICKQSSTNQNSNNIPSSNIASANTAQAMMNGDDNTNSSEGDDDQSSANMPENDTTISGSAILSSEMKATDLPSKRCIQKYNLNSEVQLALIDEINKSTNEEDKNSLIQELSNRSDLTIDELNEECFNN